MGFIYKLDFASGKSYIGLTTRTVMERIDQHRMNTKSPKRSFLVHKAWLKHGEPSVTILDECDGEELKQSERDAIRVYGTIAPGGYNLSIGGDLPMMSQETRDKMGAAHKGKRKSEQHRLKIGESNLGKRRNDETRAKMSCAQSSRDPATRNDISQHWTGKKQSEEHVAKRIAARAANSIRKFQEKA